MTVDVHESRGYARRMGKALLTLTEGPGEWVTNASGDPRADLERLRANVLTYAIAIGRAPGNRSQAEIDEAMEKLLTWAAGS